MIGQASFKPYRRPISRTWWLQKRSYFLYMLREISSIFIGLWLVLLLIQLAQLGGGRQAYEGFVEGVLASPLILIFSAVVFVFALLHSITWNQLAGVVQVVRVGERRISPRYVAAGAFAGWLVVSVVIAAIILFV